MSRRSLISRYGMSRARIWLVLLGLFAIVLGSFAAIVTGNEYWPFSPYRMFSRIETPAVEDKLRLYGVRADGSEIPLLADDLLHPLNDVRILIGMRRLQLAGDFAGIETGLNDILNRYTTRQLAGEHAGERLTALRLYEVEWDIASDSADFITPDRRELIAEVTR